MKSQMRKADRSGAGVAAIIGSDESAAREVTIKSLRADIEQRTVAVDDAARSIGELLTRTTAGEQTPQQTQQ
jgi:histidyl-tRNA synthetase